MHTMLTASVLCPHARTLSACVIRTGHLKCRSFPAPDRHLREGGGCRAAPSSISGRLRTLFSGDCSGKQVFGHSGLTSSQWPILKSVRQVFRAAEFGLLCLRLVSIEPPRKTACPAKCAIH